MTTFRGAAARPGWRRAGRPPLVLHYLQQQGWSKAANRHYSCLPVATLRVPDCSLTLWTTPDLLRAIHLGLRISPSEPIQQMGWRLGRGRGGSWRALSAKLVQHPDPRPPIMAHDRPHDLPCHRQRARAHAPPPWPSRTSLPRTAPCATMRARAAPAGDAHGMARQKPPCRRRTITAVL